MIHQPPTDIIFDDPTHSYKNLKGHELISVSTLGHLFAFPFDKDGYITRICAKRNGLTVQEQKDVWKKVNIDSHIKGKKFHKAIEDFIKDGIIPDDENKKLIKQFKKLKFKGKLQTEVILYDLDLMIAGTADLLHFTSENSLQLLDWKTNKEIVKKSKYGNYMLHPLSHLSDCNFNHYKIQLNLYKYLLEKMGYWVEDITLIHSNPQTEKLEFHSIPIMEKETKILLDFYSKNRKMLLEKKNLKN